MTHAMFRTSLVVTVLVLFAAPALNASSGIRTERVHFKKGASSAVVEAKITGDETADYVLNAKKGQYMNVSMKSLPKPISPLL